MVLTQDRDAILLSFGQEDPQSKNWGFLSLIALLAMTSCGDSTRDVWSWLFRWPQTRNLSTHSSGSWNMFWTQTTPKWIINTALCQCCQHLLSTLVSYRENRRGLMEYNHSTGEFVQLVLLRLCVRKCLLSFYVVVWIRGSAICAFVCIHVYQTNKTSVLHNFLFFSPGCEACTTLSNSYLFFTSCRKTPCAVNHLTPLPALICSENTMKPQSLEDRFSSSGCIYIWNCSERSLSRTLPGAYTV